MSSPDYNLPEWTVALSAAVQKARRLSDMGIYPVRTVRLIARCSWHGRMSMDVETTDLLDSDILSGYIQCQGYHDGKRWLKVPHGLEDEPRI